MVAPSGGADETIVTRFLADTSQALSEAEKWRTQVDALKKQLQELADQSGKSFKDVAEGMRRAGPDLTGLTNDQALKGMDTKNWGKALSTALRESEQAAKGLDQELKQKPKDVGAASKAFSNLGNITKYVFGTIIGITAITALRDLVRWFGETTEKGYEFIKSMYKAGVAINSLRFRGINASIEQTVRLVEELRNQFGTLSEKEALDIISTTQLLTRNLGFTEDKIKDVIKVSVALGIVQGKDVAETARQVVLFLSSGYGEGLQKAGIAVNRFVVGQKAMQMGLGDSYMALNEQQRALAGFSILMEQTNGIVDEAAQYQANLAGQIDATNKEIETLRSELGLRLVPLMKTWTTIQLGLTKAANAIVISLVKIELGLERLLLKSLEAASALDEFFGKIEPQERVQARLKTIDDLKNNIASLEDIIRDFDLAEEMAKVLEEGEFGSVQVEIEPILDEDAVQSVARDLFDISQDMKDKLEKNEQDLQDELAEIDQEGGEKRAEIWEKWSDTIADINQDLANDIAKVNQELADDIADVQSDMQNDLAEANQKYHDNEWKAERDFQEKMRRLREGFLFDLEDALRERDAVQIMRLYRQYALDVTQTKRQYDMEEEERRKAYEREIADIRQQAARRIAELQREAAQRIQELQAAAAREREIATQEREEALAQEQEDRQKLIDEAKVKYAEELEAIKEWLRGTLDALALSLGDQYNLTSEKITAIENLLQGSFGTGGAVDLIYSELDQIIQDSVKEAEIALGKLLEMEAEVDRIANQIEQKVPSVGEEHAVPDVLREIESTPLVTITPQLEPSASDIQEEIDSIHAPEQPVAVPIKVEPETDVITAEMEERRKAAAGKYAEMNEDFERFWEERHQLLERALKKEKRTLKNYVDAMIDILDRAFGKNGVAEDIFNYLNQIIENSTRQAQDAVNTLIDLASQAQSLSNQITSTPPPPVSGTPAQTGGYVGVTGKAYHTLGEGGYEFVLNNPTTRALEAVLGSKLTQSGVLASAIRPEGGMFSARIEVLLAPGLEAEIVDKALDGVASTFDTVIRRR